MAVDRDMHLPYTNRVHIILPRVANLIGFMLTWIGKERLMLTMCQAVGLS